MKNWQLLVPICFTWVGFVSAISFMEAWLKFQAPGVTLPIGLNIGRLVFNTLNKVEWVFALSSIVLIILGGEVALYKKSLLLLIPILALLAQSIWLLPSMDARATLQIAGGNVGHSNLHIYYVGAELFKVVSLVIFGLKILK